MYVRCSARRAGGARLLPLTCERDAHGFAILLLLFCDSASTLFLLWIKKEYSLISICLNPFPFPGGPSVRPSGPSVVRPAVESAPGVARTRPMAPRDRESIRKVAISGLDCRFGHPRPSGLDGGCPRASRLQACSAGEPWHQFVGSGCRAGKQVLSYGRTPVPSASGRFRCLVGSNVLSFSAPGVVHPGVASDVSLSY